MGDKVDKLQHQATFIKGGLAAATVVISIVVGLAAWALSTKWDTVLLAIHALSTPK